MAPFDVEDARRKLQSDDLRDKVAAMDAAALAGPAAIPLIPDLVPYLHSTEYLPVTAREYSFSGHAPLCWEAMCAIRATKAGPEKEVLKDLLLDREILMLPEASYDQGAYIGDYSSVTYAVAGLAARIVREMGEGGIPYTPELLVAAQWPDKEIWQPAIVAMSGMAKLLPDVSLEHRAGLTWLCEEIARMPEVNPPRTDWAFELRDLRDLLRRRLDLQE